MTGNEYQRKALSTLKPNMKSVMAYVVAGLCEEAGEVAGQFKRHIRDDDDGGTVSPERRAKLLDELGDTLWYLAVFAALLGFDLEEVMRRNNEKLADRKARNVIKGEGDNR